jgi:hypothetical protein
MGEQFHKLLLNVPLDQMGEFNEWWRTTQPDVRNVSDAIRRAMTIAVASSNTRKTKAKTKPVPSVKSRKTKIKL